MKRWTIKDVYCALADAVRFDDPADKCDRLRSFAVLEESPTYLELSHGDFAFDFEKRNSPYYFTDASKSQYKALLVDPGVERYENLMGASRRRSIVCHTVQIAVVEKRGEDCGRCSSCAGKTVEDIQCDAQEALYRAFRYLHELEVYNVIKNGSPEVVADHPLIIGQRGYSDVMHDEKESIALQKMIQQNNDAPGRNWRGGTGYLYGKFYTLTFCFDCPEDFEYSPTYRTFAKKERK